MRSVDQPRVSASGFDLSNQQWVIGVHDWQQMEAPLLWVPGSVQNLTLDFDSTNLGQSDNRSTSAQSHGGNQYLINAEVVYADSRILMLDCGVVVFTEALSRWPLVQLVAGMFVSGTVNIYVGSAEHNALVPGGGRTSGAIRRWRVVKIQPLSARDHNEPMMWLWTGELVDQEM